MPLDLDEVWRGIGQQLSGSTPGDWGQMAQEGGYAPTSWDLFSPVQSQPVWGGEFPGGTTPAPMWGSGGGGGASNDPWSIPGPKAWATAPLPGHAQAGAAGAHDPVTPGVSNGQHPDPGSGYFPHAATVLKYTPEDLKGDPEFMRIVAAGSKAESGWDPRKIQHGFTLGDGRGARGLFQFDLAGMGKGIPEEQLFDPDYQASKIVPLYAKYYREAPAGMSGAEKASWVAAMAERPYEYQNPNSQARQNYVAAYNSLPQQLVQAPTEALQNVQAQPAAAAQQGYTFPVQGYSGKVQNHWGEVRGGSDLFAARGTPVVAMRGGRVLESGFNSVGGNAVLIQGDDGNQYYYAHFDAAPSVRVGQAVAAGTYLGPVGDTGDAKGTGTHLHIGIGPSIRLGADKYGGTGGDYDAVSLLNQALGVR